MTHYPDPVKLPHEVFAARRERSRQLVSSAKRGVYIRLLIIIGEFVGAWVFASSALAMDAISSFIDVFFSFSLIYFIKFAERPPDKNHPFGHGRFEPLVGLQIGVLIVTIGIIAFFQQILHLSSTEQKPPLAVYAWIIPFIAVIMLEFCYRIVMKTAKKQNSPALAADALHYRIDGITSAIATVALLIAAYFPNWGNLFDHLGAIAIAFFMVGIGIYAAKNNLYQLIDTAPEEQYFDKVRAAALHVEGVRDTEKIRIQLYGPDAHVNIDIEVDPQMPVELAHQITQKVRAEIQKAWPAVRDVTVHVEPYYPGDH
jgi:cation diffusion facilitator family transporter